MDTKKTIFGGGGGSGVEAPSLSQSGKNPFTSMFPPVTGSIFSKSDNKPPQPNAQDGNAKKSETNSLFSVHTKLDATMPTQLSEPLFGPSTEVSPLFGKSQPSQAPNQSIFGPKTQTSALFTTIQSATSTFGNSTASTSISNMFGGNESTSLPLFGGTQTSTPPLFGNKKEPEKKTEKPQQKNVAAPLSDSAFSFTLPSTTGLFGPQSTPKPTQEPFKLNKKPEAAKPPQQSPFSFESILQPKKQQTETIKVEPNRPPPANTDDKATIKKKEQGPSSSLSSEQLKAKKEQQKMEKYIEEEIQKLYLKQDRQQQLNNLINHRNQLRKNITQLLKNSPKLTVLQNHTKLHDNYQKKIIKKVQAQNNQLTIYKTQLQQQIKSIKAEINYNQKNSKVFAIQKPKLPEERPSMQADKFIQDIYNLFPTAQLISLRNNWENLHKKRIQLQSEIQAKQEKGIELQKVKAQGIRRQKNLKNELINIFDQEVEFQKYCKDNYDKQISKLQKQYNTLKQQLKKKRSQPVRVNYNSLII